MKAIKNVFLFLVLIAVIVISFWLSFLLGKNILVPAKKIPTADLLTAEADVLKEVGRITLEVEPLTFEGAKFEESNHPKISKKVLHSEQKEVKAFNFVVQLGIFASKSNAQTLVKKVRERGFNTMLKPSGRHFKVFLPVASLKEATRLAKDLRASGFEAIVRRK